MGSKRSVTFGSIRSYPDRTGYEQDRSWYDRTGSIRVRKRKKIDLSTVRVRSNRIGSERSVKYLDRSWNGTEKIVPYRYGTQIDLGSVPDRSTVLRSGYDAGTLRKRSYLDRSEYGTDRSGSYRDRSRSISGSLQFGTRSIRVRKKIIVCMENELGSI